MPNDNKLQPNLAKNMVMIFIPENAQVEIVARKMVAILFRPRCVCKLTSILKAMSSHNAQFF